MPTGAKKKWARFSNILIIPTILCIATTCRDISFYFNKSIINVYSLADVKKLHDNMVASVWRGVDFEHAYTLTYTFSKKKLLFFPFSGTGCELIYVMEGPETDNLLAGMIPPYKGRVVGKDLLDDEWDVYDESVDLRSLFHRYNIDIPKDAMLVYNAPKALPNLWILFLFAVSMVFLAYKVNSFAKLFRAKKITSATP
jgi:hypothetical protein